MASLTGMSFTISPKLKMATFKCLKIRTCMTILIIKVMKDLMVTAGKKVRKRATKMTGCKLESSTWMRVPKGAELTINAMPSLSTMKPLCATITNQRNSIVHLAGCLMSESAILRMNMPYQEDPTPSPHSLE